MRRIFELTGRRVQSETRQCDVNCWELRVTDADGHSSVQYFSDPRLLDKAAATAHREWEDIGWVSEPSGEWVPSDQSLSK